MPTAFAAEAAVSQTAQKGTVVSSVAFRTTSSLSTGSRIRYLQKGETFTILDKVNGGYWYKIRDKNGVLGYVSSLAKYVSVSGQSTAPSGNNSKPATANPTADSIIAYGKKYMGTPYVFGGGRKNDKTFDCSGFTSWVFRHHGIALTKGGAQSQYNQDLGKVIPRSQLKKGDLVFFSTPGTVNKTGVKKIGHVGIYMGDNKVLHTYKVGIGVTVSSMASGWWDTHFVAAKRIL